VFTKPNGLTDCHQSSARAVVPKNLAFRLQYLCTFWRLRRAVFGKVSQFSHCISVDVFKCWRGIPNGIHKISVSNPTSAVQWNLPTPEHQRTDCFFFPLHSVSVLCRYLKFGSSEPPNPRNYFFFFAWDMFYLRRVSLSIFCRFILVLWSVYRISPNIRRVLPRQLASPGNSRTGSVGPLLSKASWNLPVIR
jgi:hypothetical protein